MAERIDSKEPKPNPNRRGGGSPPGATVGKTAANSGDPAYSKIEKRISGVPHWDDDADAWDTLFLDGEEVPGVCTVTVTKEREVKRNKPKGKSGASTTDDGYAGATVTIAWRIWEEDQWAKHGKVLAKIDPRSTNQGARAFTVGHAVFATRGVSSIIIQQISGPDEDTEGARVYTIKALEWMPPPKKVIGTTIGGASGELGTDKTSGRNDPHPSFANPPSGFKYDEHGNLFNKGGKVVKLGDDAQSLKDEFDNDNNFEELIE